MQTIETSSGDDRRAHPRYDVQLAIQIDAGSRTGRFGVLRNGGAGGLLFHTPSRFTVGETLHVTVLLPRGLAMVATGRVLRTTPIDGVAPWRYAVAFEFEDPMALFGEVLRTLVAKGSSGAMRAARA